MLPALLSLPAKISTLLGRLTSTRAGYLDRLDTTISSRSSLTQAQAASGVWSAAARTLTTQVCIKSVQRGTIQLTAPQLTGSVAISAVTVGKAFIVSSYSGPWDIDASSRVRLSLTSTTVVGTRTSQGSPSTTSCIIAFEVVEFY